MWDRVHHARTGTRICTRRALEVISAVIFTCPPPASSGRAQDEMDMLEACLTVGAHVALSTGGLAREHPPIWLKSAGFKVNSTSFSQQLPASTTVI